jgi:fumarylacetoacetate (FAA) hydrolase
MKLASLACKRDGSLVVVSDDLAWWASAAEIAPTLQAALDDWSWTEPQLRTLAEQLHRDEVPRSPFEPHAAASPLPRAYQWADGSAYLNHVALVRQARGAEMQESFRSDPLIYQGGSDAFLGPRDPIPLIDEAWGCDFEAEIAVIVDDVPVGVSVEDARKRIQLVMLVNDVSLRNLVPGELVKCFGFFQSKPASAFSPVAVTPDALGDAWRDGKLHLPVHVSLNGEAFGAVEAGEDMQFDFGQLIAHAAKTRALAAGSIIGSGTISNRGADGGPGKPIAEGGRGYACIAEQRMVETILSGAAHTPFMVWGDRVQIDVRDAAGSSIFGCIDQAVVRP